MLQILTFMLAFAGPVQGGTLADNTQPPPSELEGEGVINAEDYPEEENGEVDEDIIIEDEVDTNDDEGVNPNQ